LHYCVARSMASISRPEQGKETRTQQPSIKKEPGKAPIGETRLALGHDCDQNQREMKREKGTRKEGGLRQDHHRLKGGGRWGKKREGRIVTQNKEGEKRAQKAGNLRFPT